MISMTKLYDYLNGAFAFVLILSIIIFISSIGIYFSLNNTVIDTSQFVQNSVDDARENIREDLQIITSKINANVESVDIIRGRTDWIADNISPSNSGVTNVSNIQLVHYFAEVEICSEDYPSYKVKVDFYGINPRIEDGKLMVLSEHFTADYHEYLPVFDKNIGSSANICSLNILSHSNK